MPLSALHRLPFISVENACPTVEAIENLAGGAEGAEACASSLYLRSIDAILTRYLPCVFAPPSVWCKEGTLTTPRFSAAFVGGASLTLAIHALPIIDDTRRLRCRAWPWSPQRVLIYGCVVFLLRYKKKERNLHDLSHLVAVELPASNSQTKQTGVVNYR